MKWATFDIETGSLPDAELAKICPPFTEEVPELQPFDESSVKLGHLKDAEKIREKIQKAHDAHIHDHYARVAKVLEAKESHFDRFKESAALCPSSGRVLLIAFCNCQSGDVIFLEGNERDVLTDWWEVVEKWKSHRLAGVNILDFDLPFLIRRSWILGVTVPNFVIDFGTKWLNQHPCFFDLRLAWQCGSRSGQSSFDLIGRAFGTGGKVAGDHGKHFAELFETNRETALNYARNDVIQPVHWLARMGFIQKPTWLDNQETTIVNEGSNLALDAI